MRGQQPCCKSDFWEGYNEADGVNPIGGKNRVGRDSCWTGCAVPLVPRSLIVRVYVRLFVEMGTFGNGLDKSMVWVSWRVGVGCWTSRLSDVCCRAEGLTCSHGYVWRGVGYARGAFSIS